MNNILWIPRRSLHHETTDDGFYIIDGQRYPRVTRVIQDTVDRPGLDAWIERKGVVEAQRIASQAADWGELLHASLEEFNLYCMLDSYGMVEDGWFDTLPKSMPGTLYYPYVQMYRHWHEKNVASVISPELLVWSDKYGFAGTLDALVLDARGRVTIIDYKTVTRSRAKLDHRLQTAAYAVALWEQGLKIERRVVLQFPRSSSVDFACHEYIRHRIDCIDFITRLRGWKKHYNE